MLCTSRICDVHLIYVMHILLAPLYHSVYGMFHIYTIFITHIQNLHLIYVMHISLVPLHLSVCVQFYVSEITSHTYVRYISYIHIEFT